MPNHDIEVAVVGGSRVEVDKGAFGGPVIRRVLATTPERSVPAEVAVTLLRVFVGLSLAFAHGFGKLPPSEGFIGGVGDMGFPAPVVFAWAAALSEFVGGILLAVGFLTRPSAAAIAFTMGVAAFVRHAADPFKAKELALVYFCVALVFLVRGGGRYSVDRLLEGKVR